MSDISSQQSDGPQPWWSTLPIKSTQEKWKPAVEKYLNHFNRKIQHVKINDEFIKGVISFVHFEDAQWDGFRSD